MRKKACHENYINCKDNIILNLSLLLMSTKESTNKAHKGLEKGGSLHRDIWHINKS